LADNILDQKVSSDGYNYMAGVVPLAANSHLHRLPAPFLGTTSPLHAHVEPNDERS